jgi:hypothetical protein
MDLQSPALQLGVLRSLLSLVIGGFTAYAYIYAAFHGDQVRGNGLPEFELRRPRYTWFHA